MLDGTIVKGIGGFYYVNTKQGVFECRARGKFRKEKITPTVGDYVSIEILDKKNMKASLDIIKPRKNELVRPRVANIDHVIIIFAAVSPSINLDILDRFIILAEKQNIDITICINKIDLDIEKKYIKYIDIYSNANYDIIPISANNGTNIEKLKSRIMGKISVVAGPSGVGKSSIINCINPNFTLTTGDISHKIERGKHTTRHTELMEIFENSFIVDSPGFTSLYINDIEPDKLKYYFREFKNYNGDCRFLSCSHINEPDCCVKEHVGNEISVLRYEEYKKIYEELSELCYERKR